MASLSGRKPGAGLEVTIAGGRAGVLDRWRKQTTGNRVPPHAILSSLQQHVMPDAVYTTDSGNGTFLAMEHLRLDGPGRFPGLVDFSCMGYAVPGALGAKLADPGRDVVARAGEGALLMTGLERITAANCRVAPLVTVFRDGRLG